MKKKYIVSENQFNVLIKKKKNDKIVENIISKLDKAENKLNENSLLASFKQTILLEYENKGHLNDYVKTKLIKSGKVNNKDLESLL